MTMDISEARKRAMDQVYAAAFYPLLQLLAQQYIRDNPPASHAVMGATLRYAAFLAKQIGMRPNDFRGLAMQIFGDLDREARHGR
jgi:hypothetical protein